MKVNWENTLPYSYAQIPKSGIQHVVLDKELKPLTNPFYCKEYFQDVLCSEFNNYEVQCCGLQYKKKDILDKFYVAIRWDKGNTEQVEELNSDNIKNLLKQVEAYLGITDPCIVEEAENALLLSPGSQWISNPLYSSILLQSLRHTKTFNSEYNVIDNLIKGSFHKNYEFQISSGWTEKLKKLNEGAKIKQVWTDFKHGNAAHNTGLNSININNLN